MLCMCLTMPLYTPLYPPDHQRPCPWSLCCACALPCPSMLCCDGPRHVPQHCAGPLPGQEEAAMGAAGGGEGPRSSSMPCSAPPCLPTPWRNQSCLPTPCKTPPCRSSPCVSLQQWASSQTRGRSKKKNG